ncbi:MAG: NUDIX hydrolase [Agitococcus sp.]|nr:NUDIX hydrolase [Agitococcus sp.]MDO9177093.1 NUDIX hydrolase [Agitococcus sp.]
MTKKLSCGVLLLNERQEILLAHVTNSPQWDIPKGGAHPREQPVDTALRELYEETGVVLGDERLTDLGLQLYSSTKNLHLFAALVSTMEVDPARCVCHSYFSHYITRQKQPEMDGYEWVPFSAVAQYCVPAMVKLLTNLGLAQLLPKLQKQTLLVG